MFRILKLRNKYDYIILKSSARLLERIVKVPKFGICLLSLCKQILLAAGNKIVYVQK
jgi:hypothetical protein